MYYFKIIHKERTQVAEAGLMGACTHVFSYKLEFMAEWTSHLITGQRLTFSVCPPRPSEPLFD